MEIGHFGELGVVGTSFGWFWLPWGKSGHQGLGLGNRIISMKCFLKERERTQNVGTYAISYTICGLYIPR